MGTALTSGTHEPSVANAATHHDPAAVASTKREHRHVDALDRPVEDVDEPLEDRSCARSPVSGSSCSQRDDSIGVSVKLTSSEIAIDDAIVRPKLLQEAPRDAAA